MNLHLTIKVAKKPLKPTMAWKSWISLRHDLHSKTYARSITNGNTSEGGFHGSLAHFYELFNHERYCLKHTMITSMNEYNSEVYKSDWILTREYFSRHSLFLTCSWSSSVESGSLPNSRIWLLPQSYDRIRACQGVASCPKRDPWHLRPKNSRIRDSIH